MKTPYKACFISDWSDPKTIRNVTVIEVKDNVVLCDDGERYFSAFTVPRKYKKRAIAIMEERAKLKKEFDDSMKLVYELINTIVRETNNTNT